MRFVAPLVFALFASLPPRAIGRLIGPTQPAAATRRTPFPPISNYSPPHHDQQPLGSARSTGP